MQQPQTYVQDAAWLPYFYFFDRDALLFSHMPKESQRRVTFLDQRFIGKEPQAGPFAMQDLPVAELRGAVPPVHFIFHTAFCCSTLLTRALDLPGVAMGLKEPAVLVSFSDIWSARRQNPAARQALGAVLDLLARPLAPGETQIVKPSNVTNPLAREILDLRPQSKAIVMYSSLEENLRSTARRGIRGRAFARNVYLKFAPVIPLRTRASDLEVMLQTDLQIAAQVWLMQMAFLGALAAQYPARVRTLSSETLLARSADVLTNTGRFFGLSPDAQTWAYIGSGPIFKEHAKQLGQPFDAAARDAELEAVAAAHAEELNDALKWAEGLAARCGAPLSLGDTLLSEPIP